jgi:ABC-type lipoprotein release transport system permease subunit
MFLLLKLAFRNIFRQRRRSLLTALSMTGGYILCCLSYSLVEGSYGNIIRIFTEDETGHIQIHKDNYLRRPKIYKTIDDQTAVGGVLDAHGDVSSYTARVEAPALSYAGDNNSPVQVVGIDTEREWKTSRLRDKLAEGQWISPSPNSDDYYEALIGYGVADTLDIGIGDEIILISQGADGSIANDLYLVTGLVGNSKSTDRLKVFIPLGAAQEFLTLHGRVHEYAILLDDIGNAQEVAGELAAALPELSVAPWQVVQESFYKSMEADKRGNRVTLGIVLFIVFIGVLNTVLMSVLERTREFGVLRAVGSRPMTVMVLITLETMMLTVMSLVIGLVLAIPLIAWFTLVGIEMPQPVDIGGVSFGFMTGELSLYVMGVPMLILLAFALVVSIPPGIRAARIAPTEAMRTF